MPCFRQHIKSILFALLIFVLYFFTRLISIMFLPIFTDEAIYTRWSQIASNDAAWRFISLTDGKQPLFVWIDMVFIKFISDPLLAGRLVSVLAGMFSVIGLYFLGKEIFNNKKIGIIASIIYVIYPFSLVYDRMALYDSLVTTTCVWALFFEVLLVKRLRLDTALILGMVLGAGLLTKSSAFFYIYLLPLSLLLFDLKTKEKTKKISKWIMLAMLSSLLAYLYYSVLRLSPFFHIVNEKNATFVYPFSEWLEHPFRFLEGNLRGLFDWLSTYMTIPVVFLAAVSFIMGGIKFIKEKLFLFLWFMAPFFGLALFGKVLYPRFIFFMTVPLIILTAYSLNAIFDKTRILLFRKDPDISLSSGVGIKMLAVNFLLLFLFSSSMLRSDYLILADFKNAPIPYLDLEQYVNGWPAGGGVNEIISILKNEAEKGKIYIASEGTFGSVATYPIEIYLGNNKNVQSRGFWPVPRDMPEDLYQKAEKIPVYVIFNQSQSLPAGNWPLTLIAKYQKGRGDSYIRLYRVLTNLK